MSKVALITGASSGIGKELAHIHAATGGDLVIVARSEDKLQELKKELESKYSIKVYCITKDLEKTDSPQQVYDEVKRVGIKVDYLINNAGFGGIGKFYERAWEKDLAMINLNIIALTALTRLFLPDFVQRNSGKILNISSTASLIPGPMQAVYYASKAYVTSFSNAIAEELYDTGVTVTTLLPGATETGFGRISGMDKTSLFKHTASARIVAQDGYDGMLNGKLDVITGLSFINRILIKATALLPKSITLKQIRRMQEVK